MTGWLKSSFGLLLLVAVWSVACASRVGSYTYSQAYAEYGSPASDATLPNGDRRVTWDRQMPCRIVQSGQLRRQGLMRIERVYVIGPDGILKEDRGSPFFDLAEKPGMTMTLSADVPDCK